jgi:SOS-response transcriptional repressor LexA
MEKSNIPWEIIELRLASMGKRPAWLALQLRTGTNTVSNWKKRGGVPLDRAPEIARILNLTLDVLLPSAKPDKHISVATESSIKRQTSGMIGTSFPDTGHSINVLSESNVGPNLKLKAGRAVAVVGEVQGGPDGFISIDDYPVGHGHALIPNARSNIQGAYGLKVRGDSMRPRIKSGEYIVCEPNAEYQPGDDVVVKFTDGSAMVKELLWIREGDVCLGSINNGIPPITRSLSEVLYIHRVAAIMPRGSAVQFES